MGDPAGVGPETIAKAWREEHFHVQRQIVAVGDPEVFRRAVALFGELTDVVPVDGPRQVESTVDLMPVIACGGEARDVPPATVDRRGGQAAFESVRRAADLALTGHVDALVTAPLHKTALARAGHDYPGHTELLGDFCGVADPAMMLYLPPGPRLAGTAGLGVTHATLHNSLRAVFDKISLERIVSCAERTRTAMTALGGGHRIAVCALNPHAGENGLFGDEELETIGPAVNACRAAGWHVTGPLPADTLLLRAVAGEFDGVVAMYHDQGHIALKLLGMHEAVNITLGLPIIRTSVAHGTAFDLAWRGLAESKGVVAAVDTADKLVSSKRDSIRAASQAANGSSFQHHA